MGWDGYWKEIDQELKGSVILDYWEQEEEGEARNHTLPSQS